MDQLGGSDTQKRKFHGHRRPAIHDWPVKVHFQHKLSEESTSGDEIVRTELQ